MQPTDIISFVAFFLIVIGFSLWKSRKPKDGSQDGSDFFLGGRSLTWPIIGISIVAANISSEQMVGMAGAGAANQGIYVGVLLTAVLYTGATALSVLLDIPMHQGVWIIGAIGTLYAASGGLKAIAYADLIQGIALLVGGMVIFFVGLHASGGWTAFSEANPDKLKLLLFEGHPGHEELPWHTVFTGMWIVMIYYCGLNQFIVQRNLAAKTLRDGQLGMIFAGALWLLVPFAIVMPGIMAGNLYAAELAEKSDAAYPILIKNLIGPGLRGFIFAAIAGAIVSTLASILNSSSTIASIDVYKRLINPAASDKTIVRLGRILTLVFVVLGCLTAPLLSDQVFQFIQKFQGFIWPGVVAAFLGAFLLPRAPGSAGVTALLLGPFLYAAFQILNKDGLFADVLDQRVLHMHFLTQVLASFGIIFAVMIAITIARPLPEPRTLPVREHMNLKTEPIVKIAGALVIAGVAAFFLIFR